MIIWECNDGFVAEMENDDDFDAFLKAFTANDDVKRNCHDDDFDYDEWNDADDYDDSDFDDCDNDFGYDPYIGEYTYDC